MQVGRFALIEDLNYLWGVSRVNACESRLEMQFPTRIVVICCYLLQTTNLQFGAGFPPQPTLLQTSNAVKFVFHLWIIWKIKLYTYTLPWFIYICIQSRLIKLIYFIWKAITVGEDSLIVQWCLKFRLKTSLPGLQGITCILVFLRFFCFSLKTLKQMQRREIGADSKQSKDQNWLPKMYTKFQFWHFKNYWRYMAWYNLFSNIKRVWSC